jgi:hypothetical protein
MHKSLITEVIYLSIALSLIVGCTGIATSERFRAETVSPIAQDVQSRRVSQIAVYSLAPGQETFVAVTCDALRELSDQSAKTNLVGQLQLELLESLEKTHARAAKREGDMRWRAELLSRDGACLHTICLDGWGTIATFDGRPARINSPLRKWFKKHFPRKRPRTA